MARKVRIYTGTAVEDGYFDQKHALTLTHFGGDDKALAADHLLYHARYVLGRPCYVQRIQFVGWFPEDALPPFSETVTTLRTAPYA